VDLFHAAEKQQDHAFSAGPGVSSVGVSGPMFCGYFSEKCIAEIPIFCPRIFEAYTGIRNPSEKPCFRQEKAGLPTPF